MPSRGVGGIRTSVGVISTTSRFFGLASCVVACGCGFSTLEGLAGDSDDASLDSEGGRISPADGSEGGRTSPAGSPDARDATYERGPEASVRSDALFQADATRDGAIDVIS